MLTTLPAVTVNFAENGHLGYVVVTSRDGLEAGAIIDLHSSAHDQLGLKVQRLDGKKVYLWDSVTEQAFNASAFLVADGANLVQAAQDLYGGIIRDFFVDPDETETPLATAELSAILLDLLPGAATLAANVTVTNFPAQQHVVVDNTVNVTGGALTDGTQKTQVVNAGNALVIDASGRITVNVNGTVPVSGTFWQATQPISGNVGILGTVPVSGTFFQATQPVSVVALPLPVGAATAANQTNGTQETQVVASGNTLVVDASGRITVNVNGTVPVSGTFFQATQPISAAALPLPAGAATEATLAAILVDLGAFTKVDTGNSTSTPLVAFATYQGTATDTLGYSTLVSSIFTDQAGTFTMEESSDGIHWDVSVTIPLGPTAQAESMSHSLFARYIRASFTCGAVGQTAFRFQTILSKGAFAGDMTDVGGTIFSGMKAQLTKSVISGMQPRSEGVGYKEVTVDNRGALLVAESSAHATFGSFLTSNERAVAVFKAIYGINGRTCTTATANGGTVVWNAARAQLQTSAATNGSAKLSTREAVRYVPGQGNICRMAPVFSSPAANSRQACGFLTDTDGFAFGYNGIQFGALIRNNSVDTWIPQSSWNGDDKFDGTGATGNTLDPTKGSPMQIQMQWLGYGAVRWYVEDPHTGDFVLVHIYKFANTSLTPTIQQPSLPVRFELVNTGNNTNLSAFIASMGGYAEGDREIPSADVRFSTTNIKTNVTTQVAVLSIRNKTSNVFGGTNINAINAHLDLLTARNPSGGASDCLLQIVQNATLGGAPSFVDVDSATSTCQVDTAGTTVTGGIVLAIFEVGTASTINEILTGLNIRLIPGDTLTISAGSESGTVSSIRAAMSWHEEN